MALNELLLRNQDRIAEICTQFGIARLDAFGSIVRSDFLDASSDADFGVEFDDRIDGSALRRYFGFKSQLETLLGRPVDLVELAAMPDSRLKRLISREAVSVFAAAS
ncbi:MAG: nucleotidyltransferase domain-containing protein [Pseudomonadota bacterium]|nr:nucleotidyltransferase domain-containing protein [Gammaproteobacteria bacterium]MEC9357724.1 nucleotidyltransferase domain-containing protein [Pseudomonadota bacterium]